MYKPLVSLRFVLLLKANVGHPGCITIDRGKGFFTAGLVEVVLWQKGQLQSI